MPHLIVLPNQKTFFRWLHNLEHGAIVMLYHPCADPDEVEKLRRILTGCLYRYVITPYDELTEDLVRRLFKLRLLSKISK